MDGATAPATGPPPGGGARRDVIAVGAIRGRGRGPADAGRRAAGGPARGRAGRAARPGRRGGLPARDPRPGRPAAGPPGRGRRAAGPGRGPGRPPRPPPAGQRRRSRCRTARGRTVTGRRSTCCSARPRRALGPGDRGRAVRRARRRRRRHGRGQAAGRCRVVQDPARGAVRRACRAPQRRPHPSTHVAARVAEIAGTCWLGWSAEPWPDLEPRSPLMPTETAMAELDPATMDEPDRPGIPAGFGCPDCHGALFEIEEGGLLPLPLPGRPRLVAGRACWPQQASDLEGALWMALRSLEEKAALSRRAGRRAAGARRHAHRRPVRRAGRGTRGALRPRPIGPPRIEGSSGERAHGLADEASRQHRHERTSDHEPETPTIRTSRRCCGYLKEERGFDFTGYKRSSLMRRVDRRMAEVGIARLRRLPRLPRRCTRTSSPRCSTRS